MKKFEYKVENYDSNGWYIGSTNEYKMLNQEGQDGWAIASVVYKFPYVFYYFKREVIEQPVNKQP